MSVTPRNIREAMRLAVANTSVVDRIVAAVSPEMGVRRLRGRVQLALAGAYTGASKKKRSLSEWKTTSGSADADIQFDLPDLRDRSRDLLRNEPLAIGAVNTVVTNVVGTGLMWKSQVDRETLGWTEDQAATWQRKAEREFEVFAGSTFADVTRKNNFYGLQDLAFRSALENGDVMALLPMMRNRMGAAYELAVQLIEADRVCNENRAMDRDNKVGGVTLDEYGAPKGYDVCNKHPGSINASGLKWTYYPAFGEKTGRRNVLHLYRQLRIGQTRGVPYLAPVIELIKQLGRYTEAEVMAAVVSAMFTVFVKNSDGNLDIDPMGGLGVETGARADDKDVKLGVGAIVGLADDESIETANPGRPNVAFDGFVMAILRQIGVALELPFEILVKHFTASYTAARAAMLEAWKFYRNRRAWLAAEFCQPILEAWMDEAVTKGVIAAPGYFTNARLRAAYLAGAWHGDGPGSVDPLKEANAAEKRMNINLRSLEQEIAEDSGGDVQRVIEKRGREREMLAKANLLPAPAPAPGAAVAPGEPANESQPEQKGSDTDDEKPTKGKSE